MNESTPCHYWLNLPRGKAIAVWAYSITSLLSLASLMVAAVVFGVSLVLAGAMAVFLIVQSASSALLKKWVYPHNPNP